MDKSIPENTDQNMDIDDPMNENVTVYDDFLDSIDKSIITGDIIYIQNALKNYSNELHPDSIKMASSIIMQILEEKMTDFVLTQN